MKICYFTHISNLTGSNQSLLDILSGIRKFNVEPVVVLCKKGSIEGELNKRNIKYIIFPYKTDIKSKNPIKNIIKTITNYICLHLIKYYLIKNKIEIVHNNSYVCRIGMEAALSAKIPFVCHNRELFQESFNMDILNEKKSMVLLSKADAVIEISEAVYEKYSKMVPDANYYILHDGIDVNKYYQIHEPILYSSQVNILLAGNLLSNKGQMQAVQALELLEKKGYHNINLTLAGGGRQEEYGKQLFAYIEKQHINNITYEDFCDLTEFRRKSDIVLVCSKYEGLGRVTIEGQLSGCLVIGAATSGTKEIIADGETGLLYEYGNIDDLADKIVYAIQNPEKMNQIAQNGQEMAKNNFDLDSYCGKLFEIYKKILPQ